MRKIPLLMCASLLLSLTGVGLAASPNDLAEAGATVIGELIVDGVPVASALVVLTTTASSAVEQSTQTDTAGRFQLEDVPPGELTIKVYDAADHLLAVGSGVVEEVGETVEVQLHAPR